MKRLRKFLLQLYPKSFRQRFADEWRELADWHQQRLVGKPAGRIRFAAVLVRDTLANLPRAYLGNRKRRSFPGRSILLDVRHTVRSLSRQRSFTLGAIASLTLGVGANIAIFSVVNAVLLRPLPYENPDRLVMVWNEFASSDQTRLPLSPVEVAELSAEPGLFEKVGGVWATNSTIVDAEDRPMQVSTGLVTPEFFDVLGVGPSLGRGWTRDDSEGPAPRGVIISHELWRGTFSEDPQILERTLRVDGRPREIIGVLPEGFQLHFPTDASIPARLDLYTSLPWELEFLPAGVHYLRVVGRLLPETNLTDAQLAVDNAAERARSKYTELSVTQDHFSVHPLQREATRAARPILLALLAGVGLFLLLGAANVASLLLARASIRRKEMAVRASLGASTRRLAQLVLVEAGLIGLVGAGLGFVAGKFGAEALWTLRPEGIAIVDVVTLDGTVLAFGILVSVVALVLFCIAPLVAIADLATVTSFARTTARHQRHGHFLRGSVTVGEIAIGVVLAVGAALMGQTLGRLTRVDVGFQSADVTTFRVALPTNRFPTDAERARLTSEIERVVAEIPGVEATGATSHIPMGSWANWADIAAPQGVADGDRERFFVDHRSVTPGYFRAMGVQVLEGRVFTESDNGSSQPVVVVDRAFATRAFPDGIVVGKVIKPSRYLDGGFAESSAIVVGVVNDVRDVDPSRPSSGQVFWPFAQSARWELGWATRGQMSRTDLIESVRRGVRSVSADLAVASVAPLDQLVRTATSGARFTAMLGAIFSMLALVMAALGLYGIISYRTSLRTGEFGLRLVLGAQPNRILYSVLSEGFRLGAIGTVAGLVLSLFLTRFLSSLLYGITPWDIPTLGVVGIFFVVIALLASAMPALRATRVPPTVAMHTLA